MSKAGKKGGKQIPEPQPPPAQEFKPVGRKKLKALYGGIVRAEKAKTIGEWVVQAHERLPRNILHEYTQKQKIDAPIYHRMRVRKGVNPLYYDTDDEVSDDESDEDSGDDDDNEDDDLGDDTDSAASYAYVPWEQQQAQQAKQGRFRSKVILKPDKKNHDNDIHIETYECYQSQAESQQMAALLALSVLQPNIPHETRLPQPFKKRWLQIINANQPQQQASNSAVSKKPNKQQQQQQQQSDDITSSSTASSSRKPRHTCPASIASKYKTRKERKDVTEGKRVKEIQRQRDRENRVFNRLHNLTSLFLSNDLRENLSEIIRVLDDDMMYIVLQSVQSQNHHSNDNNSLSTTPQQSQPPPQLTTFDYAKQYLGSQSQSSIGQAASTRGGKGEAADVPTRVPYDASTGTSLDFFPITFDYNIRQYTAHYYHDSKQHPIAIIATFLTRHLTRLGFLDDDIMKTIRYIIKYILIFASLLPISQQIISARKAANSGLNRITPQSTPLGSPSKAATSSPTSQVPLIMPDFQFDPVGTNTRGYIHLRNIASIIVSHSGSDLIAKSDAKGGTDSSDTSQNGTTSRDATTAAILDAMNDPAVIVSSALTMDTANTSTTITHKNKSTQQHDTQHPHHQRNTSSSLHPIQIQLISLALSYISLYIPEHRYPPLFDPRTQQLIATDYGSIEAFHSLLGNPVRSNTTTIHLLGNDLGGIHPTVIQKIYSTLTSTWASIVKLFHGTTYPRLVEPLRHGQSGVPLGVGAIILSDFKKMPLLTANHVAEYALLGIMSTALYQAVFSSLLTQHHGIIAKKDGGNNNNDDDGDNDHDSSQDLAQSITLLSLSQDGGNDIESDQDGQRTRGGGQLPIEGTTMCIEYVSYQVKQSGESIQFLPPQSSPPSASPSSSSSLLQSLSTPSLRLLLSKDNGGDALETNATTPPTPLVNSTDLTTLLLILWTNQYHSLRSTMPPSCVTIHNTHHISITLLPPGIRSTTSNINLDATHATHIIPIIDIILPPFSIPVHHHDDFPSLALPLPSVYIKDYHQNLTLSKRTQLHYVIATFILQYIHEKLHQLCRSRHHLQPTTTDDFIQHIITEIYTDLLTSIVHFIQYQWESLVLRPGSRGLPSDLTNPVITASSSPSDKKKTSQTKTKSDASTSQQKGDQTPSREKDASETTTNAMLPAAQVMKLLRTMCGSNGLSASAQQELWHHARSVVVRDQVASSSSSSSSAVVDGTSQQRKHGKDTKTMANPFAKYIPSAPEQLSTSLHARIQELDKSPASSKVGRIYHARQQLPSMQYQQSIIDTIRQHQITLIKGETGCGKSTQIPQIILDSYIRDNRGGECFILCTQPRRISAIGLADRVSAERGESVGETIGYQVKLEAKTTAQKTRIIYCTVGVILRQLLAVMNDFFDSMTKMNITQQTTSSETSSTSRQPNKQHHHQQQPILLFGVTHIIVDEVHERSVDIDFLLLLLRIIMKLRPDIKIILMSATVDTSLFAKYFEQPAFDYQLTSSLYNNLATEFYDALQQHTQQTSFESTGKFPFDDGDDEDGDEDDEDNHDVDSSSTTGKKKANADSTTQSSSLSSSVDHGKAKDEAKKDKSGKKDKSSKTEKDSKKDKSKSKEKDKSSKKDKSSDKSSSSSSSSSKKKLAKASGTASSFGSLEPESFTELSFDSFMQTSDVDTLNKETLSKEAAQEKDIKEKSIKDKTKTVKEDSTTHQKEKHVKKSRHKQGDSTQPPTEDPVNSQILDSNTMLSSLDGIHTAKHVPSQPIPILSIPGRTFPVIRHYLPEILTHLEGFPFKHRHRQENATQAEQTRKEVKTLQQYLKAKYIDSTTEDQRRAYVKKSPTEQIIDQDYNPVIYDTYKTILHNPTLLEDIIRVDRLAEPDLHLIESIIWYVCEAYEPSPDAGALLVFLPGAGEISALQRNLQSSLRHGACPHTGRALPPSHTLNIVQLHGSLSPEDQRAALQPSTPGQRKIVLCTNVAETSITVPDCEYVIDCGREKAVTADLHQRISKLELQWCSQANCEQRMGRAGRVRSGHVFRVYSQLTYSQLKQHPVPEIQRNLLDDICLAAQVMGLGQYILSFANPSGRFLPLSAQQSSSSSTGGPTALMHPALLLTMLNCIEPPHAASLQSSVKELVSLQALDPLSHQVTSLGRLLAQLPLASPRLGKIVIFGVFFRCTTPILHLAAMLSEKSPWLPHLVNETVTELRDRRPRHNNNHHHHDSDNDDDMYGGYMNDDDDDNNNDYYPDDGYDDDYDEPVLEKVTITRLVQRKDKRKELMIPYSDHLTLINVYNSYLFQVQQLSQPSSKSGISSETKSKETNPKTASNQDKSHHSTSIKAKYPMITFKMRRSLQKWCEEYGLNHVTMQTIHQTVQQYIQALYQSGLIHIHHNNQSSHDQFSQLHAIVIGAITCGLHPQIVSVTTPPPKYASGSQLVESNKPVSYYIQQQQQQQQQQGSHGENEDWNRKDNHHHQNANHNQLRQRSRMFIHPSSVNASNTSYTIPFLVYLQTAYTKKPYLMDTSMANIYSLVFSSNTFTLTHRGCLLHLDDGFITLKPRGTKIAILLYLIRLQFSLLLDYAIQPNQNMSISMSNNKARRAGSSSKAGFDLTIMHNSPLMYALTLLMGTNGH